MSTTTNTPTVIERTIVDRVHGEVIDVADATTERLAEAITNMQELRARLADEERIVSDELLSRLDRDASWTCSVGDPKEGRVWVLKAPSPEAGTTVYPPDLLETELAELVKRGTITPDAAGAALKRTVTIKLDIPLDVPIALSEVARGVKLLQVVVGEKRLCPADTDYACTSVAAGIKALAKVPGTGAALARAAQNATPARRVSVKLQERETRA